MKKALSLILALVLSLGLYACNSSSAANGDKDSGDSGHSKESLMAQAEQLDFSALNNAVTNNIVNARMQYENKIVLITGYVEKITAESVTLQSHLVYWSPKISVELSVEDISKLSKNQLVDIVGVVKSIDDNNTVNVSNAFFVKDTYTLTGKIVFGYLGDNGLLEEVNRHSSNIGDEDRWTVQLTETGYSKNYYMHPIFDVSHASGKTITKLKINNIDINCYDNIKVTVKMRSGYLGCEVYELISLEKSK